MFVPIMMAALATAMLVEPQVKFTSDSVYTKESIVQITPVEREDTETTNLVDLQFTFDKLLGYEIYDNPSTDYIDGVKINDKWLPKSMYYESFDPTVENVILIKTVYSDDYAGMIMAARDGDYSLMLKNPENVMKLIYYIIATISILFGGFSLFRNKKFKSKTVQDVENGVMKRIDNFETAVDNKVALIVDQVMIPTIEDISSKYDKIISGLILSKSHATDDTLALIDLLKSASSKEEVERLAESLKSTIKSEAKARTEAVAEAKQIVAKIAKDVKVVEDHYDGTSI